MAVNATSFKAAFPEFVNTDNDLITSRITMAQVQVNSTVWGDSYDTGIMLMTAHLLAVSPMGEPARLSDNSMSTIYLRTFDKMMRQVTFGYRNA